MCFRDECKVYGVRCTVAYKVVRVASASDDVININIHLRDNIDTSTPLDQ